MIIHGRCFTNLEEYGRERWPTAFVAVPRIGERIEAESGRSLKVVSVTHTEPRRDEPLLKIELHR
jgi:hypothetical protein